MQENTISRDHHKKFSLALIFALLTLLKQGYESWGVTESMFQFLLRIFRKQIYRSLASGLCKLS
jgi:hypothetical protein